MDAYTKSKLDRALLAQNPTEALLQIARKMKVAGASQSEVYAIYSELLQSRQVCENEQLEDAVREVMDFITGWCASESRLFDTYLQT